MKMQEARTLLQRASLSVLLGCEQGDQGCFGVLSGAAHAAHTPCWWRLCWSRGSRTAVLLGKLGNFSLQFPQQKN